MNNITIQEQIIKLFKDESTEFRFKSYNESQEMCIYESYDPTGGTQHDFEYYVSFNSEQELIAELSDIDPDYVKETEYDIRTDPELSNEGFEIDEDCKQEIKYVCEKWGETLKHVISKIVNHFSE